MVAESAESKPVGILTPWIAAALATIVVSALVTLASSGPSLVRNVVILIMLVGSLVVFLDVTRAIPRARWRLGRLWGERAFVLQKRLVRELSTLTSEYKAFHAAPVEVPSSKFTIGTALGSLRSKVPFGDASKALTLEWNAWLETRNPWGATASLLIADCDGGPAARRRSVFQAAVRTLIAEVVFTRNFAQNVASEFRSAFRITDDVDALDVWKQVTDRSSQLDERLKLLAVACDVEYYGGPTLPPLHASPAVAAK